MGTTSARFLQKNIDSCVGLDVDESSLLSLVPGGAAALTNPMQRFDGDILIAVLDKAEALSGDSSIGFRCGLNHGNHIYHDMPYTIQFCKDLNEAFAFTQRYEPLVQQYSEHFLTLRETDADIVLSPLEDGPEKLRHVMDLALSTVAGMSMWVKAVHGFSITKITVRHSNDSYEDLYMRLFDCPIEYSAAENRVTFDRRFLGAPLPGSNPEVLRLLTDRFERDLKELEKPIGDDRQVAAYLEEILGASPPTIEYVASMMGISERSVRRRLKDCGTSFRQVLENIRRERYQVLVRQPELSQVQIAGLLGYSEQSAFSRAHKKWHGVSPAKT